MTHSRKAGKFLYCMKKLSTFDEPRFFKMNYEADEGQK
jgi:hypothetical protein